MRNITFLLFSALLLFQSACKQKPVDTDTAMDSTAVVYPEYVKELSEAIARKPDEADLYYQRAAKLFSEEEDSLAWLDARMAVKLNPRQPTYQYLLGNLAYENNEIAEAQTALREAVKLDPKYREAWIRLARVQFDLRDYEAANKTLEAMSKEIPDTPESYFLFGLIKRDIGDTLSALSNFKKAVNLDNEFFDAYMQIGLLYAAKKDRLGIDYLNNAVRIDSTRTEALYARGMLFQDLGLYPRAVKDYSRIIALRSDYAPAYYNVGWINFRIGKYEEAIGYFSEAIIADESYADAYYMRGLCYQSIENNTEALRNYEACLKINPQHSRALEMKGLIK